MVTYNFYAQAKPLKRSDGRSVVAAAAYRAGERLVDKTIDVEFDFSPRSDSVLAAQIFVPANSPDWASIREELWNQVELHEIRGDAQLARELQLQFPTGLTLETRCEMLWDFCRVNFAEKGMIADAVIHEPGEGDQRNDHAHVLLTMRYVTIDGFGNKNRDWNKNACLENWKQDWLIRCNKALAAIDSNIRFERRSIEDQRSEKLAAFKKSTDWLEKRTLEIEAERLDYVPRPHLPQKVYRAMVAGKPIPKEYVEAVKAWKIARDSKEAAEAEATRLQTLLNDELAISAPNYTDQPYMLSNDKDQVTTQDDLANDLWKEAVGRDHLKAGLLVQLADANPGASFDVLVARLPDFMAIIEADLTGHFYFGLNFLRNIGKQTRDLGWRQFPFIADILREEIDWLENPDELVSEAIQQDEQASKHNKTDTIGEQQETDTDDAVINDPEIITQDTIENSSTSEQAPSPSQSSEETIESAVTTGVIVTNDESITGDAIQSQNNQDADSTVGGGESQTEGNQSASRNRRTAQEARAEGRVSKAAEKAGRQRSRKIEQQIKESRARVLRGRKTINTFKGAIGNIASGSQMFTPHSAEHVKTATVRFLSAAGWLLAAWESFRNGDKTDANFDKDEKRYIKTSMDLTEMHLVLPAPKTMSGKELYEEQDRLNSLTRFADQGLVRPVMGAVKSRFKKIANYLTNTTAGITKAEDLAREERQIAEGIARKREREKAEKQQAQREYDQQLRDSTAKLISKILTRAETDSEVHRLFARFNVDMSGSRNEISYNGLWLETSVGDRRIAWYALQESVRELDEQREEATKRAELRKLEGQLKGILNQSKTDVSLKRLIEQTKLDTDAPEEQVLNDLNWFAPVLPDKEKRPLWVVANEHMEQSNIIEAAKEKLREEQKSNKISNPKRRPKDNGPSGSSP